MTASCLKPSLYSASGARKFSNHKTLNVPNKNQNLIKPLLASTLFLFCFVVIPEKPSNLASICEKYNSSVACQVW
tara:strand:+ start:282 stop:506 length:225 start_codon:yes stop_codon:yes gene_type:complete